MLSFEIINKTDDFVVFPFDNSSLTGYEYVKSLGNVVFENPKPLYGNADDDQIKLGVRVVNEKGELAESVSHSYPNVRVLGVNKERKFLSDRIKNVSDSIIVDYYKKRGIEKPYDWILFDDYLLNNMIILNPKEAKRINIVFNLSSFYEKTLKVDYPIEFAIKINDKGYNFYLELNIRESLYAEYQLDSYIEGLFDDRFLRGGKISKI